MESRKKLSIRLSNMLFVCRNLFPPIVYMLRSNKNIVKESTKNLLTVNKYFFVSSTIEFVSNFSMILANEAEFNQVIYSI